MSKRRTRFVFAMLLPVTVVAAMLVFAPIASDAQEGIVEQIAQHEVLALWPDGAPGTPESWVEQEYTGQHSVTFVTRPTLTVFHPKGGTKSDASVIVAPGGAFSGLAIRKEGIAVAQWFADRGITAFLLKYRVRPFFDEIGKVLSVPPPISEGSGSQDRFEPKVSLARADGMQAVRLVRASAQEYGIAPDKVGFIGFSAGAMTAMNVTLAGDSASRPDFVIPIYGAMPDTKVPADAPPAFVMVARDDSIMFERSVEIFERWSAANRPVEFHAYEKGGHGFGMQQRGLPVDRWPAALEAWLVDQGLIEHANEIEGQ